MFLTRKALIKIWLITGLFIALALVSFWAFWVFSPLAETGFFLDLGIFCLSFAPLAYFCGRYVEGKGALIERGRKLVTQQLRPAEFIRLYMERRNFPDHVIAKPDYDVLYVLALAYDAAGDPESELAVLDDLFAVARKKKKPFVNLLKASVLFGLGRLEEGEGLYNQVRREKMDLVTTGVADFVLKSDRAMAYGDYTTAETYFRQKLAGKFPGNTPLALLSIHFALAMICMKTERTEEARQYLKYCIEHGGETHMQAKAVDLWNELYIVRKT